MVLLLKADMEGQLERERRGFWMRRGGGQTPPGAALDGAKPRGQPARGGVLVQGQSSYQTGGSLTDPANLPNYRGPGLQPRSRGALLTPHGEGIASQ